MTTRTTGRKLKKSKLNGGYEFTYTHGDYTEVILLEMIPSNAGWVVIDETHKDDIILLRNADLTAWEYAEFVKRHWVVSERYAMDIGYAIEHFFMKTRHLRK